MSPKPDYQFPGFPEGAVTSIALPEMIFSELVPHLDDLDELKVVLLVLWRLARMRSNSAPWITEREVKVDGEFRMALPGPNFETRVTAALQRAVNHGILLVGTWENADGTTEVRYFANSPQGRTSVAAMRRGTSPVRAVTEERPNIFTLYEQNIGPLTALLSEDLMEAEQTYPEAWIEDAFREAVRLNKRNWKYVQAILERWQAEGRDEIDREHSQRTGKPADRQGREAATRRYIEDAYDRLVQH